MDARIEQIWTLAEPLALELGCEVLDIEFAGAAPRQVLRIYLDRPDDDSGVSLDDCVDVSRRLGDVLDAHEALEGRYMLEVSSPGVNRPLRRPPHFARALGEQVFVRLRRSRDGRRNFTGTLLESGEEGIVLACGDETFAFGFGEIDRANVEFRFEDPVKPGGKRKGK